MRSSAVAVEIVRLWAPDNLRRVAPGVVLCAIIAAIAFVADKQNFLRFGAVWIPPLILTLVIGMALQPLSDRAVLKPGIEFAGRTLLRVGVALYGARLTFGQLVDGGALPVLIALAAVSCTIVFGAWASRLFGLSRDFGLLTGCATGVCGAAAAMAASAVLPKHANSDRDLAFTVMGVNFISTVTMVIYPTLHDWLHYSLFEMGVHYIDAALHCVGAENATITDATVVTHDGFDIHTDANFTVIGADGGSLSGELKVTNLQAVRRGIEITFENASIAFDIGAGDEIVVRTKHGLDLPLPTPASFGPHESFALIAQHWRMFFKALDERSPNFVNACATLLTTKLIEQVYERQS